MTDAHETSTFKRGPLHSAICACGWQGPLRVRKVAAWNDAKAHDFEAEEYKSAALQAHYASNANAPYFSADVESEPDAIPATEKATQMKLDFEPITLMVLGTIFAATEDHVNLKIDEAADVVVKAVNDSETQIDDAAAEKLASAFERFAARVRVGVKAQE